MSAGVYRAQVAAALDALVVEGLEAYRWLDRSYRVATTDDLSAVPPRERLLRDLVDRLYDDFYCRGRPERSPSVPARPPAARAAFVEALSAANSGAGTWAPGWTISAVADDSVSVCRDGLELVAPRGRYRTAGSEPPRPGAEVHVLLAKERFAVSPGYYVAVSNAELDERAWDTVGRVYFNVGADGAERLVATVTDELNVGGIAFRLKVLDEPLLFFRADPAVLFLDRAACLAAGETLRTIVLRLRDSLGEAVPALTKRLAPGVAYADSPSRASYGAQRCGLIAAGVVEAFEAGAAELDARVECVVRAFQRAELALDAPYLEPGAVDEMSPMVEARQR